jgi:hypothetical protein
LSAISGAAPREGWGRVKPSRSIANAAVVRQDAEGLLGGGDGLLGLPDAAVFGDPGVVQPRPRVRFVVVATPGGLEVGGDSVQAAGNPNRNGSLWPRKTPASTAARRCG